MDKYNLPVCESVYSSCTEVPKVYEVVLPDYLPNIVRVLKTEPTVTVESFEYSGGFLTMQVNLKVRVLYVSEQKGYIKSAEFPFKFEYTFDCSRIQSETDAYYTVEAKANVLASSAKIKGARSVEIKVNTLLCTNIFNCTEHEFVSPDDNSDVQLRFNTINVSKQSKVSEKSDNVYEDITLEADFPAIAEITDYTCNMLLDDIKTKEGAVEYDGKMILKCTYRTENTSTENGAEYVYLTKEIPVSGQISSENVKSGDEVTGSIKMTDIDMKTSFDPYGENRIINVTAGYEVMADVVSDEICMYADDGYCMMYDCDFEKQTYKYDILCGKINEKTKLTEKIPSERVHFTQITDSGINMTITGNEISGGKLFAVGKCSVWIMGIDESSEPCCLQTAFNVRVPVESAKNPTSENKYLMTLECVGSECAIRDGEISVGMDIDISGLVFESDHIEVITKADVMYDSPKPACRSEYIVYYPEKSESAWDICKKYQISQNEFCEANELKNDYIGDKKIVVIPCRS